MLGFLNNVKDVIAPTPESEEAEDKTMDRVKALRKLPPLHPEGFPEARVEQLKLVLPTAPDAGGAYSPVVIVGDMCYISGQGPLKEDGTYCVGKVSSAVGASSMVDEAGAVAAARQTGLTILSQLKKHLGSLNVVARLVKVTGFVNCTPEFTSQPKVIDGFSELMIEVFGEAGRGARSAVGMSSLPANITVEVEAIFQLSCLS